MTGKVRLSGRLICASVEQVEIVRQNLPEHIRLTRDEPGCLSFDVTHSEADPMIWLVEELFSDRAAFDAHQARTRASDWGSATAGITRDYKVTTSTVLS